MRRWRGWLTLVLALSAGTAGADELKLKEMTEARRIYVAKCAKCHKFYEPKSYNDADWQKWMDSMSRKSKLKADQEDLLKRYLQAYRAGRIAAVK